MTRTNNISKSFKMMSWFKFRKLEQECCSVLRNDTED